MLVAVGVLARRVTTKIGALLLHHDLRYQLFLGSCHWKTPLSTYGTVSFKRVNTARGFFLDDKDDLELFSRTVVAVIREVQNSRPLSP